MTKKMVCEEKNKEDRKKRKFTELSSKDSICDDHLNETSSNKFGCEEQQPKRPKIEFLYALNGQEKSSEENTSEEGPDKKALSTIQLANLDKLLKLRKKARHERVYLELMDAGKAACISQPESERVPLPFDDYKHFLLTTLFAHNATRGRSRWINCRKYMKLDRHVCLVIEGVGLKEYYENKSKLNHLTQFEKPIEVMTPVKFGGDLICELALISLTNSQMKKVLTECGSLKNAFKAGKVKATETTVLTNKIEVTKEIKEVTNETQEVSKEIIKRKDKFSRKELLLTVSQMIQESYPIETDTFPEYVFTRKEYGEVNENSPMWAIDCEMCVTYAGGSELTWICIVDEDYNVVYETLVKPKNKIKDYVTRYSGITSAKLKNVTTRLEDVQADIRAICPPDVIFVGQSLNSDLHAMKMIHPYVIDTSVIFNIRQTRQKSGLRLLSAEFLSLHIQTRDKVGHSPVEDAIASLMLVQKKLRHSVKWGNALLGGVRSLEKRRKAKELLDAREEAGIARIAVSDLKRIKWEQLTVDRNYSDLRKNGDQSNLMKEHVIAQSMFMHLTLWGKIAVLIAKKNYLEEWEQYITNVKERFHKVESRSNRAAVKYLRDCTPSNGTGIAYVSLVDKKPEDAILKADKLIKKLMKSTKPNTLYSILLSGSRGSYSNGVLLLHLAREKIPVVPQFEKLDC